MDNLNLNKDINKELEEIEQNEKNIKLDEKKTKLKENTKLLILINIILLVYAFFTSIRNIALLNKGDVLIQIVNFIFLLLHIFIIIAIVEKIIVWVLIKLNKWKNKVLLVISLVVEIINLIFLNRIIITILFVIYYFYYYNKILLVCGFLAVLEIVGILIIVNIIKSLMLFKKFDNLNNENIENNIEEKVVNNSEINN